MPLAASEQSIQKGGFSQVLFSEPFFMTDPLPYDNPLITRYASKRMVELWGPQRKHSTWRRLWLALAEAQHELGMTADDGKTPRISAEQLAELRAHLDDIDFAKAAEYERK